MGNLTKNTITRGAVVALALSAGAATTANAAVTNQVGADRYATANTKILGLWPAGSTTAILAAGEGHDVDALTVAPLAKMKKAPIILVDTKKSATEIANQFAAYTTVYIANGNGVVTDAVKAALEAKGIKVTRLGGADRYATALAIAKEVGTANSFVVTNGEVGAADALSIASIAAAKGMPIFLTNGTSFDEATTTWIKGLNATSSYVLGGPTLVAEALKATLPTATRLYGADRYATNAAVLNQFKSDAAIKTDKVYLAGGETANLIDALTAAPLAGLTGSPIVFVAPTGLTADAKTYLTSVVTGATDLQLLGGAGAAANTAVTAIQASANVAVSSVSATGSKTLKVTFSGVVDTAKAVITVKKGSVAVNTDSVVFSADKTFATITTTTKLSAGDYTVSVAGLTTTALTGTVTAADEKVAKINITSAKAPRLATDATQATVLYTVVNQYGEKMTGQAITWTVSTGQAIISDDTTNGKLVIEAAGSADFIPGALVYITGVHAASGTVVNGQVEIGLASQADTVTFKGVYDLTNLKVVDLPAGFASARYVLLLQVNDQYGNTMVSPDLSKLVFTSNNPLFVASTSFTAATPVVIDGVTYSAVDLVPGSAAATGGSVVVQAISTITGKISIFNSQATALSAVKSFSMSAPTVMVAEGETVEVPFAAIDQYGNAVTSFDSLNASVTVSPVYAAGSGLKFVKQNDGSAKLMYTAPATGASASVDLPVYLSSVVANGGNFSSAMISVKETAIPTAIVGVDSGIATKIAIGNSQAITAADLIVQDQYGRTMSDTQVNTWLNGSNSSIVVTSDAAGTTPFEVKMDSVSGTDAAKQVIKATATSDFNVTIDTQAVTAATETITFTLATDDAGTTPVASSAKAIAFTKVEKTSYVSYEVADLGKMFNDNVDSSATSSSYNKTLKVYGVMADGTKVLLPAADYTITTDGKLSTATPGVIADLGASGYVATDLKDANGVYTDVTVNVLVTVNDASGSALAILPKQLVVSNIASKVTAAGVRTDLVTAGAAFVNPATGVISNALLNSFIDSATVIDQYGVADAEVAKVTITNLTKVTGSSFAVTNNGLATTAISGATLGDKFTATFKYASGVTVTINFTVGL